MKTETGEPLFEIDTDLMYRSAYNKGREDAIEEVKKYVYRNLHFYNALEQKGFYGFLEQLKERGE